MRKLISSILVFSMLSLNGCSLFNYETGTKITDNQLESVNKGSTDKSFILSSFGQPTKIMNTNDSDLFVYEYSLIRSFGGNTNEAVTFVVNKKGIVKDVIVNRNSGGSNPFEK